MFHILLIVALAWIQAAQQPADMTAKFNRAVELQRKGALKEAAAEYRTLLDANPNYIEALANLGAVKSDPVDPNMRYLLARAYQQLGGREDAAREFAEVERLKAEQLKSDRARIPKP